MPNVSSWRSASFRDLQTRGFVLIPSFLSPAEVELCREEFARQPLNRGNRNYQLSSVEGSAKDAMTERVKEVLDLVNAGTDLCVDFPLGGSYFATGRGIKFSWHQDHESFFTIQNHYDYLNFYIPIQKPRRDKSNLCIVPFDVLEKEHPRLYRKLVRGGATSCWRFGGRALLFHDDTGRVSSLRDDLDRLACTPQLDAGDLLLHRTQDTETDRVSLSFRAARAETPVRRSRLADGGPVKALMMMNDARTYERMFEAFAAKGRPTLGYAELQQAMDSLPPSESMGRKRFFRYLLRQKAREGVLLRFFGRSAVTWLMSCFTVLVARVGALKGSAKHDGPSPGGSGPAPPGPSRGGEGQAQPPAPQP